MGSVVKADVLDARRFGGMQHHIAVKERHRKRLLVSDDRRRVIGGEKRKLELGTSGILSAWVLTDTHRRVQEFQSGGLGWVT